MGMYYYGPALAQIGSLIDLPGRIYQEHVSPLIDYAQRAADSVTSSALRAIGFHAGRRPGPPREGLSSQVRDLSQEGYNVSRALVTLGQPRLSIFREGSCPAQPNYISNISTLVDLHTLPGQLHEVRQGAQALIHGPNPTARVEGAAKALVNSSLMLCAADSLSLIAHDWGFLDDRLRHSSPSFNWIVTILGAGNLGVHAVKAHSTSQVSRTILSALSDLEPQRRTRSLYSRPSLLGVVSRLKELDPVKLQSELQLQRPLTRDLELAERRLWNLEDRTICSEATNLAKRVNSAVRQRNFFHKLELLTCASSTLASVFELVNPGNSYTPYLLALGNASLLAGRIWGLYVNGHKPRAIRNI